MKCPKCEEGEIELVILKMTGEGASLCDLCGTMWLENEDINSSTGHSFDACSQGNSIEYVYEGIHTP